MSVRNLDPIRAGAFLYSPTEDRWLRPSDVSRPLVVFIPGFTAKPDYLEDLATFIGGYGFSSALFSYDSSLGIDQAAHLLLNRLEILTQSSKSLRIALVGHSMGGLVARYAVHHAPDRLQQALRAVVLLGSPNRGTLNNPHLLSCFQYCEDLLGRVSPFKRWKLCRSAKQLTLTDPEKLIHTLNRDHRAKAQPTFFLSVSGGYNFLELEGLTDSYVARCYNATIQRLIGETPNDGLVPESSANLSLALDADRDEGSTVEASRQHREASGPQGHSPAPSSLEHRSDYLDYARTNHTYLTRNYEIAGIVGSWLQAALELGQTEHGVT